jgi:acyl carrier protein
MRVSISAEDLIKKAWRIVMLEKLKEILGKVLPDVDMSRVSESTRLVEELGFDSLAMMMMAMEIEDAFGFKFSEFVKFETVGDVCGYLESRV